MIRIPVTAQESFSKIPRMTLGPTQSPIQWISMFFQGIKGLRHECKYSPPSTTEVKNGWNCNSTPPICLHGMDKENFTIIMFTNS
jgi:hypothetical protein